MSSPLHSKFNSIMMSSSHGGEHVAVDEMWSVREKPGTSSEIYHKVKEK